MSPGSLPTCSVCNTAHEMMRSKKWSGDQKEVILKFLRLHLRQQLTERLQLEKIRKLCKESKGNIHIYLLVETNSDEIICAVYCR